jgi:hypothetical protein
MNAEIDRESHNEEAQFWIATAETHCDITDGHEAANTKAFVRDEMREPRRIRSLVDGCVQSRVHELLAAVKTIRLKVRT